MLQTYTANSKSRYPNTIVGAVGHVADSHDGGGVGLHRYHLDALFFEVTAGLRAGVVDSAAGPVMMGPEPMTTTFLMLGLRGVLYFSLLDLKIPVDHPVVIVATL
jgi:hypothetical protein